MTDPQGGSPSPQGFVFPPFAPPVFRQGTPPEESPPPIPPVEPTAGFELEVPLPAHDVYPPEGVEDEEEPEAPAAVAAPEGGEEEMPWEAAGGAHTEPPPAASAEEGGDEELPWLELPAPPRVHAVEEPAAAPADEEVQPPPLPDWMSWNPPAPAAEEPAADDVVHAGDIVVMEEPAAADEYAGETPAWDEGIPELPAPEPAAAWDEAVAESQEPAMWDGAIPEAPGGELVEEAPAEADAFPTAVNSQITDDVAESLAPAVVNPQITDAVTSSAGGLGDVADRLEAAARALREDPDGFLRGGAGDPLHLLLAGFVLGYRQGREAGNG